MSAIDSIQCPTAIGTLLLHLYVLETEVELYDPVEMADWWEWKFGELEYGQRWFDSKLWRLYARHIHAIAVVNNFEVSDLAAYRLGIAGPQIAQPVGFDCDNNDEDEDEVDDPCWVLSDHVYAPAPLSFRTWQNPLSLRRPIPAPKDIDELPADIAPSQVHAYRW